ncbi:MAG TPA: hypothetical protein VG538_06300 [Vicinamibacterales bacterium]|jgi:hypothetical protein|nr:hypothetical protein [Vicinamibacterales bacterium]
MSPLSPQVARLESAPERARMRRVRNAETYDGRGVDAWWRSGAYRGNKPSGGLWTSSYTPDDDYLSDWHRGLAMNRAIQIAQQHAAGKQLTDWLLVPSPEARVCMIASLEDAVVFTRDYRLATLPRHAGIGGPLGVLVACEITNWEAAGRSLDAVSLTADAADAVAYERAHARVETAFHTWNCESTLWFRWAFVRVEPITDLPATVHPVRP